MNRPKDPIRLIIGLGNPDPEYAPTYHNVGHQFVLFLIRQQELCMPGAEGGICAMKLLKTDAYMNESGACVTEALKKYGLAGKDLLVVHDDSDIPIGEWKMSFGRNAGGHRGVQNVIDHMGTNAFWRLRFGIRPKSAFEVSQTGKRGRWIKAETLVLKKVSAADRKALDAVFAEAAKQL